MMKKKYYVHDILPFLLDGDAIVGNNSDEIYFDNITSSKNVNSTSLDWINQSKQNKQSIFEQSRADIVICDREIQIDDKLLKNKCIILADDPKHTFANVANSIFNSEVISGIHNSAIVSKDAVIHSTASIGPLACIGDSEIGEESVIHAGCIIYDNVRIGKNVVIHAGTVIGADGFGYIRNNNNELVKFPHVAGVIIGDNVEIGSNTSIDRGSLSDTIIMDGAKIDNLVHIAHNVVIGRNAAIIANSMIAGSAKIGNNAWVAPSASILEQLEIGKNVLVGVGAVVTKNIPEGETWTGSPAKPLKEFIRIQGKLKSL
jgi:UDP-3-O-[3-hydroxymyristoyl] glucosamine N-acyltransferase